MFEFIRHFNHFEQRLLRPTLLDQLIEERQKLVSDEKLQRQAHIFQAIVSGDSAKLSRILEELKEEREAQAGDEDYVLTKEAAREGLEGVVSHIHNLGNISEDIAEPKLLLGFGYSTPPKTDSILKMAKYQAQQSLSPYVDTVRKDLGDIFADSVRASLSFMIQTRSLQIPLQGIGINAAMNFYFRQQMNELIPGSQRENKIFVKKMQESTFAFTAASQYAGYTQYALGETPSKWKKYIPFASQFFPDVPFGVSAGVGIVAGQRIGKHMGEQYEKIANDVLGRTLYTTELFLRHRHNRPNEELEAMMKYGERGLRGAFGFWRRLTPFSPTMLAASTAMVAKKEGDEVFEELLHGRYEPLLEL